VLQVNLVSVIVFSVALVVAAVLVTYTFAKQKHPQVVAAMEADPTGGPAPTVTPAWGELSVRDIRLKPPEEYVAFELQRLTRPSWNFYGTSVDHVRQVMLSAGLTEAQVGRALEASKVSCSASSTTVYPDGDLIEALAPATRAKLYHELGRTLGNEHMLFPFSYTGNDFSEVFGAEKVSPESTALVKKLMYPRGDLQCFSDYEYVLQKAPNKDEKLRLINAFASESALMAGIRVRPDTDIDKLLGYWAWPGGVRAKDVEPLLDSLKDVPDGRVGLVYLLPQFARQRLYTFPMPSQPGDTAMDCHWSTMNFFNEVPDDRFANPAYTVRFLQENYYSIAGPSKFGDIIMFMDGSGGNAIHSAVYLADDIVFTKNGNNMAKPWMLMHLKDVIAKYESDGPPHLLFYRNRKW